MASKYTRKVIIDGKQTIVHFYSNEDLMNTLTEARKFVDACRYPCKAVVYEKLKGNWKFKLADVIRSHDYTD